MTTWTAPRTWVTGALAAAALNTDVRDDLNYLYEKLAGTNADKVPFGALDKSSAWPASHVRLTTTWVMANNAETAINYNAADVWDTDSIHDTVTNNTRLTPHTRGLYLCYASLAWPGNATGSRYHCIKLNGATHIGRTEIPAGSALQIVLPALALFTFNGSTDYVEHIYFQNSGGTLTNPGFGSYSTEFGLIWLAGF